MTYDVFISFKNSGKDGLATPDAIAARKVYEALKSQKIKAFFSEESLAEEGRGHFSKSIEKALEASRVLILVASCREHIESQWVEAEWDSFSQDIRSGNKKGELFIYNCGDLRPNNLPLFLRRQQMFPEVGLAKLVKFVSSAIPSGPTLDSCIQLALHCFHPEKNEDKVYLVTVQQGTSASAFNVTAHWGARAAKRLSSQIKAVNVTDEKAKVEIEKAKQEKVRGGYSPAAHAKLLTDEARSFLSASLGLSESESTQTDSIKGAKPLDKKKAAVPANEILGASVPPAKESVKTHTDGKAPKVAVPAVPAKVIAKSKSPDPVKVVAKPKAVVPVKGAAKPKVTVPPKIVAEPKAVVPVKAAAKSKFPEAAKLVTKSKVVSPVKVLIKTKAAAPSKAVPATVAVIRKPIVAEPAKASTKPKAAVPVKVVAKAAKTICISGKLPSGKKKADYEGPLRAAGYELVDDVVKGLSYLVLAETGSISSKSEKARKMGVEVISEDRLAQIVRQVSKKRS